jgi:hypothetical protein
MRGPHALARYLSLDQVTGSDLGVIEGLITRLAALQLPDPANTDEKGRPLDGFKAPAKKQPGNLHEPYAAPISYATCDSKLLSSSNSSR